MIMARANSRRYRHFPPCWPEASATPKLLTGSSRVGHLFPVLVLLLAVAVPASSERHESLASSLSVLDHENGIAKAALARTKPMEAARSQVQDDGNSGDDELKQLSSKSEKSLLNTSSSSNINQKQKQSANYRSFRFEHLQPRQVPLLTTSNVTTYTGKFTRRRKRHSAGQKLAAGSKQQQEQQTIRRQVIQAMLKGQVSLPCVLDPPQQQQQQQQQGSSEDDVPVLVLWYKDKSSVPIYSVDARSVPIQEARHKPGPYLEGRSTLRIQSTASANKLNQRRRRSSRETQSDEPLLDFPSQVEDGPPLLPEAAINSREELQPESDNRELARQSVRLRRHKRRPQPQLVAQLVVDSLSSEDNGLYSCRVDFRKARARTQEFDLRIIVPADKPVIRDLTLSTATTTTTTTTKSPASNSLYPQLLGPHSEGTRVILECETQGGYPEPSLSWWRDGRLIDDSYESADGSRLEPATDRFRPGGDPTLQDPQDEQSGVVARLDPSLASAAAAADDDRSQILLGGGSGPSEASATTSTATGSKPSRLIRNRLELGPLTRADLMANYSCQAWNTKLSEPPTTSVMIDMNLRPIKVQIENERHPVLADKPFELLCNAYGSRPAAVISWWRGQQRLTNAIDKTQSDPSHTTAAISSNVTSSTLTLVPHLEDAGQLIRCRAESAPTSVTGPHHDASAVTAPDFIEDSWRLEVHYLPRVRLALGEKLQGTSIREGQDVYFECTVRAQPSAHEIRWWFEGKELETNVSLGVIISNQSLVLQRVKRQQRGHYTCSATNQVGESHSNTYNLRVQYAPICRDQLTNSPADESPSTQRHKSYYGAARMESVRVYCHVDADPPDSLTFKWAFVATASGSSEPSSNSLEQNQATANNKPEFTGQQLVYLDANSVQQASAENPLVSVATYTPRSELDYGTLLCWASSSLGQQQEPCAYQVVPAERPDPLRNCRLANASDIQLTIACEPGYDGGVDQSFRMEVYESEKRQLVANVSATGFAPTWFTDSNSNSNNGANNNNNNGANNGTSTSALSNGDDFGDDEDLLLPHSQVTNSLTAAAAARQQRQRTVGSGALQLSGQAAQTKRIEPIGAGPQPLEAVFITQPILEPATEYFLSIYSTNAKGASKPVSFTVSTQQGAGVLGGARQVVANSFARDARRANGEPSHLLSDVLQLSWSPFLLICAVTILVFVMFASITFAMMKYVDFSSSSGTFYMPANGATSSAQSSCTGYDDRDSDHQQQQRTLSKLTFGRSANRKSKSSSRARVITLTESGDGGSGSSSSSGSSSLSQSSITTRRSKQHDNVIFGQRSRFGLQQQNAGTSQTLRPSNSDLQLNAASQRTLHSGAARASLCGTLPKNNNHLQLCHQFNTAYLQTSLANNNSPTNLSTDNNQNNQNQLTALMLSKPSSSFSNSSHSTPNDGRVEQLVISGKQYIHQTSFHRPPSAATPTLANNTSATVKGLQQQQQRHHLQLTGAASSSLANSPYGSLLRAHHHVPNSNPVDGNNNNLYAAYLTQGDVAAANGLSPAAMHDRLVCIATAASNFQQHSGDIIDGAQYTAGSEFQTSGYSSSGCQLDLGAPAGLAAGQQMTGAESDAAYSIMANDIALATVVNNNTNASNNNNNCSNLHCHLSDCNSSNNGGSNNELQHQQLDAVIHTNESNTNNSNTAMLHGQHHNQQLHPISNSETSACNLAAGGDSDGMSNGTQRSISTTLTTTGSPSSAGLTDLEQQQKQLYHHHLYTSQQQINGKQLPASASGSTTSTLTSTTTDHALQTPQDGIVRIISNSVIKSMRPNIVKKNLAQIQDFVSEPTPRELYEIQPLDQYTMYVGEQNVATPYNGQTGHHQFIVLPAIGGQLVDNQQQFDSLTRPNKARVKLMTQNDTATKIPIQYRNNYHGPEERNANNCNSQTTNTSDLHTDV